VHYAKGRPAADAPGFSLALSPRPTRSAAGMLTFASRFAVPPGKPSHLVAASCCYAGFEPLRALAFRVHTHELGRWGPAAAESHHIPCAAGEALPSGSIVYRLAQDARQYPCSWQ
jgi:hypothetical protein